MHYEEKLAVSKTETRRYLWYLILCSIVVHPSCLNRGSDGAMGSWSNINFAVLFLQFKNAI